MSAFGDAFKAAREAGKKTFTFNGKSYHTRTKEDEAKKPDVSKAKAGPAEYETKKAPPMDEATKARVQRNKLEQAAMRGKPIQPMDNSPKKIGEDSKVRNEKPMGMPESRRLEPKAKAPEVMKTPGKADETDLPLNERGRRTRERARNSDTGTDKRSVNERIKEAIGMKKGGMVKKASAKKGSVARGGGAATRGTKFQGVF